MEPDNRFQLSAPLTKLPASNKPCACFGLPFLEGGIVVRGGILDREIDELAPTYYSAITTESQTASYRRIEGDWAPISSPAGSISSAARNQSWIDFDVSFDR